MASNMLCSSQLGIEPATYLLSPEPPPPMFIICLCVLGVSVGHTTGGGVGLYDTSNLVAPPVEPVSNFKILSVRHKGRNILFNNNKPGMNRCAGVRHMNRRTVAGRTAAAAVRGYYIPPTDASLCQEKKKKNKMRIRVVFSSAPSLFRGELFFSGGESNSSVVIRVHCFVVISSRLQTG